MVKLTQFSRLIRFQNLVIVALTQYLLQYLVLRPVLFQAGHSPTLDSFHFFLLVLDTVVIAAGGYLVNDLLDYEIDLINKPDKVFIGRFFSEKTVLWLYISMIFIGLAIAWYLAGYVENRRLFLIYPIAVGLLFLYSKYFKKWPLVGNVVVAAFCAFVAGVVLFAERETFSVLSSAQPAVVENAKILFGGYLVFAFLSTLLREIVKDLEDVEGDSQLGLQTLPIAFGAATARKWAFAVNLVLIAAIVFFSKWLLEKGNYLPFAFTVAGLVLPLGFVGWLLEKATEKAHYSRLSQWIKWVMLAGLMVLILC